MTPDELPITLMGEDIQAKYRLVAIDQLSFLPDNPRVYASIREMADFDDLTPDEQQVRIYEQLLQEPSVKKLIPEIRRDGGLQEPVIVRWDKRQVIEGNSRLAAYRKLSENSDHERWNSIKCLVVTTLTDDQQTRLLAQAHLHGKTDWTPYAQALFCFRRIEELGVDRSTLSILSGMSVQAINRDVKVIQLMKENHDDKQSRFSYYYVLVTNRSISPALEHNAALKNHLLAEVKSETFTAQEMRDRLPTIIQKPKILRKFQRAEITLEEAFDRAKISHAEQRLKKIRELLDDIERDNIAGLELQQIRPVQQVVRRIQQSLKRVSDMVDAELKAKSASKPSH